MFLNTFFIKYISVAGSFGGGQVVTVTGNGFDVTTTVQICNTACDVVGNVSSTALQCRTASATGKRRTAFVQKQPFLRYQN